MSERLLRAHEVGELLGLSTATILDWFEEDPPRIPGFKLGQAVRFRASEVEAWLEERRRGPAPNQNRFDLSCSRPEPVP